MKKQLKKSGQKIIKKLSLASKEATEKSKTHIKEHIIARTSSVKNVRLWVLEWLLLVSVIILFAVVQTIWYHNSYQSRVFVSGGTYSEATIGQVNSMNPLYAATSSEKTLSRLLFSNLLTVDASGNLGNDLAESVKIDETGKIWTVTLRDGLKWSDGEPITSDDIVLSFNLINSSAAKTTITAGLSNVKIEQVDRLSVNFILPTVYVAFYDALDFPIVPAHILSDVDPALVYEHNFSSSPVSSGPFTLNALQSTTSGKIIHLNQNTNYHRGDAMLSSFVLRTYNTSGEIVDALNRAEVTASADITTVAKPNITNSAIYNKKTATNNGAFIFFNTLSESLSNMKLRQALRQGIDIDALREGLEDYNALDYPIFEDQIEVSYPELPEYDKEKAAELFAEAGYEVLADGLFNSEDQQLSFRIVTITAGNLPEIANRLKEQLFELGIIADVSVYDTEDTAQSFFTSVIRPRDYDILLYEIDMGNDPDLFPYYHSSQATSSGLNFSDYKSGIVDDLLLSARTTFDASLRKAKYESFLGYWVSDVPAIGLYRVNLSYYFNSSSRTFSESNTLTSSLDRFSDVIYWATEKDVRYRTP